MVLRSEAHPAVAGPANPALAGPAKLGNNSPCETTFVTFVPLCEINYEALCASVRNNITKRIPLSNFRTLEL